jgi:hypothetical protein
MKAISTSRQSVPPGDGATGPALHAIADGLTAHGFDVSFNYPAQHRVHQLQLTNVRGAMCGLALTDGGGIAWEYRPFRGASTSAAEIVAIVLGLLGARHEAGSVPQARHYPGLALKGVVGRNLAAHGMAVSVKAIYQDDVNYEIYAEIAVTNPDQPGRGRVRVGDDGTIQWDCPPLETTAGGGGLDLGDVVQAIATGLAGHDT